MSIIAYVKLEVNLGRLHLQETPKGRGRLSAKRPREEEAEVTTEKSVRLYKGEPVPEEQPILLSGAVMRDYQVCGGKLHTWSQSLKTFTS